MRALKAFLDVPYPQGPLLILLCSGLHSSKCARFSREYKFFLTCRLPSRRAVSPGFPGRFGR